ncbi:MAG: hypothetical protein RBR67_10200 [Desulfobacterium sp.]|nr:hypothetical protein [Desulfobacterium sp.]
MSLPKELLDRLVCAKYIFRKGIKILEKNESFASGIAVSHFQDSAEIILRVIIEYLHCSIKDNAPFNQIMDVIDNKDSRKLSHRSALNQLNKARVNFKHFGLEPKIEDAKKLKNDLEGFFPNSLSTFLNIDYNSISLTNLIRNTRIENFLNKAEECISDNNYGESVNNSAIAFGIYQSHFLNVYNSLKLNSFNRSDDRELQRWAQDIEKIVVEHQKQLDLIIHGINQREYIRFKQIIPPIHVMDSGNYSIINKLSNTSIESTRKNALFCLRFAIDAILLIKQNRLPSYYLKLKPKRRVKVLRKSPIIVYPTNTDDDNETIRFAEIDEILWALSEKFHRLEYISVIQDEEKAYIKERAVMYLDM